MPSWFGRSSVTAIAGLSVMLTVVALLQFQLHYSKQNEAISPPLLRKQLQEIVAVNSLCDFSSSARRPFQHIVTPPSIEDASRVCCNTTAGPLGIEVYPHWAPLGAKRFIDMVSSGFFNSKVRFFRSLKGFLLQFGLSDDPKLQSYWHSVKGNIPDDPAWLPMGPQHRVDNISGVFRYQEGYVAYAGGGKNSRCTQIIVALAPNKYLGGGSPWETPFGVVVGEKSYATLQRVFAEYGEAVQQGKIMNRGAAYLDEEFPKLDAILNCEVE